RPARRGPQPLGARATNADLRRPLVREEERHRLRVAIRSRISDDDEIARLREPVSDPTSEKIETRTEGAPDREGPDCTGSSVRAQDSNGMWGAEERGAGEVVDASVDEDVVPAAGRLPLDDPRDVDPGLRDEPPARLEKERRIG